MTCGKSWDWDNLRSFTDECRSCVVNRVFDNPGCSESSVDQPSILRNLVAWLHRWTDLRGQRGSGLASYLRLLDDQPLWAKQSVVQMLAGYYLQHRLRQQVAGADTLPEPMTYITGRDFQLGYRQEHDPARG